MMEGISRQQKQSSMANNLKNVKEEPLDDDFKHEFLGYQEQYYNGESENFSELSNVWSFLVKRCRLLLQDEYGQMNSYLLAKILIKEVNDFLLDIVTFFKDCCIPISQEEIQSESILEVDGLLVNCLPAHPQNLKCFYRICSDIPKTYLETLFSLLPNEFVEDSFPENAYLPLAPNVEINIKKEITDNVKIEKKILSKSGKKLKQKKSKRRICDICGKDFKSNETLRSHVSAVHEKKKPWKCNKCGDTYKYRSGLDHHRKPGRCPGVPKNENKWIKWKNSGKTDEPLDPKCLHPDCVDQEHPRFTYAGIMNHIIDLHTPGSDDSVSTSRLPYFP